MSITPSHCLRWLVVCTLFFTAASQAIAIPPIILRTFTFDTDTSTFTVTGGIAGIHDTYSIDGNFGIALGMEQVDDPEHGFALVPFVQFAEVDAILTSPPGLLGPPNWMAGADLDSLLNLTGLEGSFVFPPDEHPGLLFTGVDGGGQPMQVSVTVENKQLHLLGENNPGCCDMFNFQLDAYADIPLMGDINGDGYVGLADLDMVLGSFDQTCVPFMGPDVNADGHIGLGDLDAVLDDWNKQADLTAPVVIPEPTTCIMASSMVGWLLRRRG